MLTSLFIRSVLTVEGLIQTSDMVQWSHQPWRRALLDVWPPLERRGQVILARVCFCNISQPSGGQSNPDSDICWIIWQGSQQTITNVLLVPNAHEYEMQFFFFFFFLHVTSERDTIFWPGDEWKKSFKHNLTLREEHQFSVSFCSFFPTSDSINSTGTLYSLHKSCPRRNSKGRHVTGVWDTLHRGERLAGFWFPPDKCLILCNPDGLSNIPWLQIQCFIDSFCILKNMNCFVLVVRKVFCFFWMNEKKIWQSFFNLFDKPLLLFCRLFCFALFCSCNHRGIMGILIDKCISQCLIKPITVWINVAAINFHVFKVPDVVFKSTVCD